jgi:hypothetical protein
VYRYAATAAAGAGTIEIPKLKKTPMKEPAPKSSSPAAPAAAAAAAGAAGGATSTNGSNGAKAGRCTLNYTDPPLPRRIG